MQATVLRVQFRNRRVAIFVWPYGRVLCLGGARQLFVDILQLYGNVRILTLPYQLIPEELWKLYDSSVTNLSSRRGRLQHTVNVAAPLVTGPRTKTLAAREFRWTWARGWKERRQRSQGVHCDVARDSFTAATLQQRHGCKRNTLTPHIFGLWLMDLPKLIRKNLRTGWRC